MNSDFGCGFAYNLGLFLAHQDRFFDEIREDMRWGIWFNSAADHLFELQIPKFLPLKLRKRILTFKKKCLEYRFEGSGQVTIKDVVWALDEAKFFLMELDKYLKIKSIKGTWE